MELQTQRLADSECCSRRAATSVKTDKPGFPRTHPAADQVHCCCSAEPCRGWIRRFFRAGIEQPLIR
ncbi:hypothetical protein PF011_g28138, partial [Phytophthora fragariae]